MRIQTAYFFMSHENPYHNVTKDENVRDSYQATFDRLFVKLYDCIGVYNDVSENSHCYILRNSGEYNQAIKALPVLARALWGQESFLVVQGKSSQLVFTNNPFRKFQPYSPIELGELVEVDSTDNIHAYTIVDNKILVCKGEAI